MASGQELNARKKSCHRSNPFVFAICRVSLCIVMFGYVCVGGWFFALKSVYTVCTVLKRLCDLHVPGSCAWQCCRYSMHVPPRRVIRKSWATTSFNSTKKLPVWLQRCDLFATLLAKSSSGCYIIEHLCQRQNEQQLPVTQADNEHVFVFI